MKCPKCGYKIQIGTYTPTMLTVKKNGMGSMVAQLDAPGAHSLREVDGPGISAALENLLRDRGLHEVFRAKVAYVKRLYNEYKLESWDLARGINFATLVMP